MTEADAAGADSTLAAVGASEQEHPGPRIVLTRQLVFKVLAVIGVLLLVYFLIYLGTWLAMLN